MLDGPFLGSEAVSGGLLSGNQLRGPKYHRIFPNVYVRADQTVDFGVRSHAAYLLVRDRGGLLAGYSAALLLGADCAPVNAPAEVLVPHRFRDYPGLRAYFGTAVGSDLTKAAGVRVTSAIRTAWDLCRRLSVVEAVVALDALSRVGRFRPTYLIDRRAAEPRARGCRRLDKVVALANPRAESPMETRLRLDLIRGGLEVPEVQLEIRDEYGVVLARVDLAYRDAKLAIEYDGSVHYTRRRGERDRQRDAMLAGYGWETLRLGRDDIGAAQTVWRVRNILATRSRLTG
ncbi:MAG: DUF559 domain-containing protein [Pseudonocardia sp.]|nr:DUF559 domain-containing protein [Pseudonocardia sp.]